MGERKPLTRAAAVGAVVLLGLVAYLPALNNPFIADDYAFLGYVQSVGTDWRQLAEIPLGLRRLTTSLVFYLCFSLFGLHPGPYYGVNLLLHMGNAGLVGLLVRELTSDRRMVLAAALFFVAYERHQEAIFWINTSSELLVAAGVLATAIFFARFRRSGQRRWYGLALAAFAFSAVSKESFVVVAPLLVLLDLCLPRTALGRRWLPHVPFWLVSGAYLVGMYLGPGANPFYVTSYGISSHFFGVYLRTLHRLLLFVYVLLLLGGLVYKFVAPSGRFQEALREKPFPFFTGWLLVTLVPYSFLLYADQLPSRHTYVPSVATAGLVGFLFVRIWEQAGSRRWRLAGVVVLALCLAANVVHLWRKDAEYLDRAAPTDQLIAVLNREAAALAPPRVVVVYDFPYSPVVAWGAAQFFTPVGRQQLLLRTSSDPEPPPADSYLLRWNPHTRTMAVLSPPR